jgi:hypothetical protein
MPSDTPRRRRLAKSASAVPSYDLSEIKSAKLNIAGSARDGARALGLESRADMYAALATLQPAHFYKSMPADKNPAAMMDVYHLPYSGRTIYVKFARDPNGVFALTSFKEK